MSVTHNSSKTYLQKCTGNALETAGQHQEPQDITLFGNWLSPFAQSVWVALEYLGIPYKYYEVNPYEKSQELLEVSPKGLVPALKVNVYNPPRGVNESTVILEYLEEVAATTTRRSLLPPSTNPYARAIIRLQCDHIDRILMPAFYRYIRAQEPAVQAKEEQEFNDALQELVRLLERAEREILDSTSVSEVGGKEILHLSLGLWVEGGELGLTDVMAGPWLYRASTALKHYKGFVFSSGDKFNAWCERLFNHPSFKATCNTERRYIEGYEQYAYNRPYISQVANGNSGKLP